MVILFIWGVVWSIYSDGANIDLKVVIIPPYACYRGVASIWEEPKWKEDWEAETETIGTIIAMSYNSEAAFEIISYKNRSRKWIRSLPEDERTKLKVAADSFGDAYTQYSRNLMQDLMCGSSLRPITDPSIEVFVQRFNHELGLMSVWKKIVSEDEANRADLNKQMEEATYQKRFEMFQYRDVGVQSVEANAQQLRDTIDDLFSKG